MANGMTASAPPYTSDVLNVLVVEDDADARENMRDILELQDHRVATRRSFAEVFAIEHLAAFDVIILDRKLPDGMVEDQIAQDSPNLARDRSDRGHRVRRYQCEHRSSSRRRD